MNQECNGEKNQILVKSTIKIDISVPIIEQLLSPTIEYSGGQILQLAKYIREVFVPGAIKHIRAFARKLYIKGLNVFDPDSDIPKSLLFFDTYYISTELIRDNFYDEMPEWNWPYCINNTSYSIDSGSIRADFILKPNDTVCDTNYFLKLLSQSLSLNKEEKMRVIKEWPRLTQFQVDSLIEVFNEERDKFLEIYHEHKSDIYKLIYKRLMEWAKLLSNDDAKGIDLFLLPSLNGDFIFKPFVCWKSYWPLTAYYFFEKTNNYMAASYALQQAIVNDPENIFCLRSYGLCFIKMKYFNQAYKVYDYIIKKFSATHTKITRFINLDLIELSILCNEYENADKLIERFKNEVPICYDAVYDMLVIVNSFFTKINIKDLPFDLNHFLYKSEIMISWSWSDLKGKLLSENGIDIQHKKELIKLINLMITKSF